MTPRHRSDAPVDPSGTADAPVEFAVLAGDPTPEELAAVTVVLTGMAREVDDTARADRGRGRSAWQRSQVPLRAPLRAGDGRWGDAAGS